MSRMQPHGCPTTNAWRLRCGRVDRREHHGSRFRVQARALSLAALCLSQLACGPEAPSRWADPAPNVVLIVLDTLRPDRLGCYGYERATSPHIDALAAQGFVFENAQSAAPWTAPALVSLMTGLQPDVHQVESFPQPLRMSAGVTTLAEILRAQGYATAAFTEGGYAKGDFGLDQGFDVYPRNPGDDESNVSNQLHPSRLEQNVERSVAWLRTATRPFLLFFHTYEPHYPYQPEPGFLELMRPSWDAQAEREALGSALATWARAGELDGAEWSTVARHRYHCDLSCAGPVARPQELERALRARGEYIPLDMKDPLVGFISDLYDAEIAYADRELQRLLDALDELGLREDTLIVITSDHGESLGEHGEVGHGALLSDVVLRTVLIVRAPHLALEPRRIRPLVRSIDVLPTVVELLGGDPGRLALQGRSVVPLLAGTLSEAPAFSQANSAIEVRGHLLSVCTERWRLVAERDGPRRWLFDLEADPGETRNVGRAHPQVVERLERLLGEQRAAGERLRERFGPPSEVRLSNAQRAELEALGYASGAGGEGSDGDD